MRCVRHSMLLYAVTDRAWTGPESSLKEQVEAKDARLQEVGYKNY